jgi:hypothetical protein
MISHEYKCIFIHIPGTAGTSVETAFLGNDLWYIKNKHNNRRLKHITASQSKKIYKEYWSRYFKFTIIRNPWDRTVSMGKNKAHMIDVIHTPGSRTIDLTRYIEQYGDREIVPKTCRRYLSKWVPGAIYQNYINVDIDMVYKFENLTTVWDDIVNITGCRNKLPHVQSTSNMINQPRGHYTEYYNDHTREQVRKLYERDLSTYNYNWNE